MADPQLRILGGEAFIQDFFLIRLAVAIGIAQMGDVRGHGDDGAVLPQEQPMCDEQVGGPRRRVLEEAVAVLVFENADAAPSAVCLLRSIPDNRMLTTQSRPSGAERHRDRTFDLRPHTPPAQCASRRS